MGAGTSCGGGAVTPGISDLEAPDERLPPPPEAALTAAKMRGDVVVVASAEGPLLICLCRPRRLEVVDDCVWKGAVTRLSVTVRCATADVILSGGAGGMSLQVSSSDTPLLRLLAAVARLATRANVPHDIWGDLVQSGCIMADDADLAAQDLCLFCGRDISTAPTMCSKTGRVHPSAPYRNWEPPPPAAALEAACQRGDGLEFQAGVSGQHHQYVYVRSGRLEKMCEGLWRYAVESVSVPHVGAQTVQDSHEGTTSGCRLPLHEPLVFLHDLAVLADRAGVRHNLWEHCAPPRTCSDCGLPLHLQPFCPETHRPHSRATPLAASLLPARQPIIAVRQLSGPSEGTPHSFSLAPTPDVAPLELRSASPAQLDLADDLDPQQVTTLVDDDCCVCMEEVKNTVLMPCRHLCVCSGCAQILTLCPLCRFQVLHRFEVR